MTLKLLLRALATFIGGSIFLGLLVFLPAGTFAYWQGWVTIVVFAVSLNIFSLYFSVKDPALMQRRLQAGPGAEQSLLEKIVATVAFAGLAAAFVVPALDRRFGWSHMPAALSWIGEALIVLSVVMFTAVFRVNSYASSNITVEQNQSVSSSGPYAVVRHPLYSGSIVMGIGIILGMGSYWGLAILLIMIPALVVRILDEEKMMERNLPGYREYEQKIRYRLVPPIW